MCRNITTLRGLEPPATAEEIDAAALQFLRKVTGVQKPSAAMADQFAAAVEAVAAITTDLIAELPPRRTQPKTIPPLRRIGRSSLNPARGAAAS